MSITEKYYHDNSQEFFESTVSADVTPLYDHFLKYLPIGAKILDFGCGSGRDTKAFIETGYIVDAIDGSADLCRLASEYTGIEVRCMSFMDLSAINEYDAIWACASLLHASMTDLPGIISKMKDALKPAGIVYMSFKYGDHEGERDGRYFTDMTAERFLSIPIPGLSIIEAWYSEDVRREKDVKWYNVIVRKE